MLTNEEKQKLRETIEKNILRTQENILDLEELTRPIAPENAIGRISRMDAINNKSINDLGLRQAREKLNKLKNALIAIDKPDYGKCIRCGKLIPLGRLLAMPESTCCTACA